MELNAKELNAVVGGKSSEVRVLKDGDNWVLVKDKNIGEEKYTTMSDALKAAEEKNGKKKKKDK